MQPSAAVATTATTTATSATTPAAAAATTATPATTTTIMMNDFDKRASALLRSLPEIDADYLDTAFHNYYVDYGAPSETLSDICAASTAESDRADSERYNERNRSSSGDDDNPVTALLEDIRHFLLRASQLGKADVFWDLAVEIGRNERYFLGLVYIGVSQAVASGRIRDKIVGLLSCRMYLMLMLVPKTGVSLLFPSLLQSCLSMLSLPTDHVSMGAASNQPSQLGTPPKSRGRSTTTDSKNVVVDDEVYPVETLQEYVYHVTETLDCLRLFLCTVSLEEHDDVVSAICQQMALLTANEMVGPRAYEVLAALCDRRGLHGDLQDLLRVVSFKLSANLLMLRASLKDQVPRAFVKARDSSIRFLIRMRERAESDDYLIVTIQQLAMRSLEKSDIRFRTAQGVLQLLLHLEEESLSYILQWFHKMIRSKLPRHRMFSLELFGQICSLQNTPPSLRRHVSSIALAALERVMDDLASVKAKAFAFFAQLTNTPHWMDNLVTSECTHEDVIGAMLGILHECVKDSKVHVRKSALNVLNGILCGDTGVLDKGPYVDVIVRCCRDQTILVRKHALDCLSKVYRRHPIYFKEFVSGVFPLTMDNEPSVQEKALACVLDVVFDSQLPGGDSTSGWNVLRHLGTYERYLPLICEHLCRKDAKVQLGMPHVKALVMALSAENASLAWKLLSYLCNHTRVDLSQYHAGETQLDDDAECCRLSVLVTQTKPHDNEQFLESLMEMLNDPSTSFMRMGHICSILLSLDRARLERWAIANFPDCVATLKLAVTQSSGTSQVPDGSHIADIHLLSAMFKAGECVLAVPQLAGLHLCTQLRAIVQDTDHSVCVRRTALRVLGQISLVSVDLAKRLVTLIGDTVDNADDLSLRVIGIRTVADLSCRYATLTDDLLPVVYCLLKDPEVEVRRAAITSLLQLLMEDYIKLRNNFLYHMLECVLDEDEMLRDLSEFGLDQFVLKKNPSLFLQNFIDCVFHLNGYRGHSLYNQVLQTPREIQTFSLAGQRFKRQIIYRFMVRRLTDEHKFLLTLNICNNVLKAIVDNETAVDRECPAIVIDLLEVLCMDELRLRVASRGEEDEAVSGEAGEEIASVQPAVATPNTRHTRKKEQFILNAIKLKTMIESILPPLTMLKSRCEDNEELMTALMSYLNVLNQEYKNELKALLVGDSASEFYNDLKKFEASRSRLDESTASNGVEDPEQENKMRLIMKVLQSARKQHRALLNPISKEVTSPRPEHNGVVPPVLATIVEGEYQNGVSNEVEPIEQPAQAHVVVDRYSTTQEVPDDLVEDIVDMQEEAVERSKQCSLPAHKDDNALELSGFEPLSEENLELERLRLKGAENGILVEGELDGQQSTNGHVLNGVADEPVGLPAVPPSDDAERVQQVGEETPTPYKNHEATGRSVEQNGVATTIVNGHGGQVPDSAKHRKRPYEDSVDDAEDEERLRKDSGKRQRTDTQSLASANASNRKRRLSRSTTLSEVSTPSRPLHTARKRICQKDVEVHTTDGNDQIDRQSVSSRQSRLRSSSCATRSSVRMNIENIPSAPVERVHGSSRLPSSCPARSDSVITSATRTTSSSRRKQASLSMWQRSSLKARRAASAAAALESRWRHHYRLQACEVVISRLPAVELCAREMQRTGQSTFRMVTKASIRAPAANKARRNVRSMLTSENVECPVQTTRKIMGPLPQMLLGSSSRPCSPTPTPPRPGINSTLSTHQLQSMKAHCLTPSFVVLQRIPFAERCAQQMRVTNGQSVHVVTDRQTGQSTSKTYLSGRRSSQIRCSSDYVTYDLNNNNNNKNNSTSTCGNDTKHNEGKPASPP